MGVGGGVGANRSSISPSANCQLRSFPLKLVVNLLAVEYKLHLSFKDGSWKGSFLFYYSMMRKMDLPGLAEAIASSQ